MTSKFARRITATCICASMLASCATSVNHATFVTKTSFSIVDVDSTPPSITVAYDRFEGYIGPRFADGSVYPVAGFVESEGQVRSTKSGEESGLLRACHGRFQDRANEAVALIIGPFCNLH